MESGTDKRTSLQLVSVIGVIALQIIVIGAAVGLVSSVVHTWMRPEPIPQEPELTCLANHSEIRYVRFWSHSSNAVLDALVGDVPRKWVEVGPVVGNGTHVMSLPNGSIRARVRFLGTNTAFGGKLESFTEMPQ